MGVYRLARGFVVQIGERRFAFHRDLDSRTVQFEDIDTGAYRTMSRADLVTQVMDGKIAVIGCQLQDSDWITDTDASLGAAAVIDRLDEKRQKEWERRHEYVLAMRRRGVSRAHRTRIGQCLPEIAAQLGDDCPPSSSTVIRWLTRYEKSGGNPVSLVPQTVVRKARPRAPAHAIALAWKLLQRFYFVRQGESVKAVFTRYTREQQSGPDRKGADGASSQLSLSSFYRLAGSVSGYERDRARIGPSAANAKWRHAIGGIYAKRPLERVEMDHTELDLYVIDDIRGLPIGRPVVTVLIDSFTRYILSIYLSFEGETLGRLSRSIRLALRPKDDLTQQIPTEQEWLTPGLWECLVVDNGLAFQSPQLRKIALALGCELEYCPVRKPWFKPTVERVIGEMTRVLPMRGRPEKMRGIVNPRDPVKDACVMFSDLCRCLTKWVVDVYPMSISERTLERPFDRLQTGMRDMPAPAVVTGISSLEIITGLSKEVAVRHSGVELMYLPYRSAELAELARKQRSPSFRTTIKYDPNDLGRIWVQDPTDRSWIDVPCMYQDYATGLTRRQHQMIRGQTKAKLRGDGAYDELMRAQGQLQDMFDGALNRGKGLIKRRKSQAIFQGLTSVSLAGKDEPAVPMLAEQVVTQEDLQAPTKEIPTFQPVHLSDQEFWEVRK